MESNQFFEKFITKTAYCVTVSTIMDKIFETDFRFHVKQCTTGKGNIFILVILY